MEKMNGTSKDIVANNISKLKEIFPEAFTEDKVDFEILKEILGEYVDNRDERYSFTWSGKSKARMIAQTPSTGTLRPYPEESVDWDTTKNIFIEGDNLEVLKLLQKSYHKKVKMIYIDPPYNKGTDFVYKDNFKDNIKNYKEITGQVDDEGHNISNNPETSGRYHTDWLNMMFPRLKLARNLLKDNGVIFISIDDNEVFNLRKMCDEVFGEENFVGLIPVINNMKGRNDKDFHAQVHEYLIAYKKRSFISKGLQITAEKKAEYNQTSIDGKQFQWRDLRKRGGADTRRERPNLYYPIYVNPETGAVSLNDDEHFSIAVLPTKSNGEDGRWRWEKETLLKRIDVVKGRPVRGKSSWNISYQVFLDDPELGERREKPKSVWIGSEFSTDSGTKTVNKLLPGIDAKMMAPKALGQIYRMIELALDDADIVLDFFAGSATTAHAVMQLNAENASNRKFIMVQLPETCAPKTEAFKAGYRTIAEISKERMRRASYRIKENHPMHLGDIGFRVFKLDSTNIKPWEVDFELNERTLDDYISNIKQDRSEEDVLYEILLKYGLDLTLPIEELTIADKKVFNIGMGALIICLADSITLKSVEGIANLKAKLQPEIMRVVFKDSGFKNDVVKTNAVQILKQAGIADVRSL